MKLKSLLLAGLIALVAPALAQTDVVLHLNQMFNGTTATQGEIYQVQGSDFYYDRIQYYMSDFVLIHDGGEELSLGDLVFLVDSDHGTSYNLGNHNVVEVEQIRFSIGVNPELNHLDPSTYELSHPLAHQNPSMHWGWTSGYRFLCLDGYSGSDMVQIHALGDANFLSQTHEANTYSNGSVVSIFLDADYDEILTDLNIIGGVYEHSETSDPILAALDNMQNLVFSPGVVAVEEPSIAEVDVYPNPTSDSFRMRGVPPNTVVRIFDLNGRLVQSSTIGELGYVGVSSLSEGIYSVSVENAKCVRLVVSK